MPINKLRNVLKFAANQKNGAEYAKNMIPHQTAKDDNNVPKNIVPSNNLPPTKDSNYVGKKLRQGVAFDKNGLSIKVDSNHVSIGKPNPDNNSIEFFGNITTNKQTYIEGRPPTKNIPLSNSSINGKEIMQSPRGNTTYCLNKNDPNYMDKRKALENDGFIERAMTQWFHPWDHKIVVTHKDGEHPYHKTNQKAEEMINDVIKKSTPTLDNVFTAERLAALPVANYVSAKSLKDLKNNNNKVANGLDSKDI